MKIRGCSNKQGSFDSGVLGAASAALHFVAPSLEYLVVATTIDHSTGVWRIIESYPRPSMKAAEIFRKKLHWGCSAACQSSCSEHQPVDQCSTWHSWWQTHAPVCQQSHCWENVRYGIAIAVGEHLARVMCLSSNWHGGSRTPSTGMTSDVCSNEHQRRTATRNL